MEGLLYVVLSGRKKKTCRNFTFCKTNNPENRTVQLCVYIFKLVSNKTEKKNAIIHIISGQLKIVNIVPRNFDKIKQSLNCCYCCCF